MPPRWWSARAGQHRGGSRRRPPLLERHSLAARDHRHRRGSAGAGRGHQGDACGRPYGRGRARGSRSHHRRRGAALPAGRIGGGADRGRGVAARRARGPGDRQSPGRAGRQPRHRGGRGRGLAQPAWRRHRQPHPPRHDAEPSRAKAARWSIRRGASSAWRCSDRAAACSPFRPSPSIASVDQLLAKGHVFRGYLGAGLQPVRLGRRPADAQASGSGRGILVVSLDPDGPAARSDCWLATSSRPGTPSRSTACARSCARSVPIASDRPSISGSCAAAPR